MANELQIQFIGGVTVYFLVRSATGLIYNGSILTSYVTANFSQYPIDGTQQGSASGYYTASFPSGLAAGAYEIVAKQQTGGSPAETDPTIGVQSDYNWNGSATAALSDSATSGQVSLYLPTKMTYGVMVQNFYLNLVSQIDGITPFVSGVVSGQISRNGGGFGPLQSGAFTEIGLGWYSTNLTSGDLQAATAALNFTAVGISGGSANPYRVAFVLQKTSGVA